LTLPPTLVDLRLARWLAEEANVPAERQARIITWTADEKVLMAVVGLAWLVIRVLDDNGRDRNRTDHLALTIAVSAVLPHLAKHLVQRKRPDRRVVGWPRHGVPRSGRPYDSFPSGHAVHMGAAAAALSRWVPRPWRTLIWAAAAGLAATRLVLLAHWLTDVLAGLTIGTGLEAALYRVAASWRAEPHGQRASKAPRKRSAAQEE
jgi:undecaprenyl-diphosphatase